MGAPKLKWTPEEEAALRAGIYKYGTGKWSTILKDPEFKIVLCSRSNVDLKDKWRNIQFMASGSGSRQKHRISIKIKPPAPKRDEEVVHQAVDKEVPEKEVPEIISATPHALREIQHDTTITKKQIIGMDDVVMEAIRKLNEPRGSSRSAIAQYIEDHYLAPPEFEKALAAKMKALTENGLVVQVKRRYRIAPMPFSVAADRVPTSLPTVGSSKDPGEARKNRGLPLTKAQIDAELEMMKYMTPEEATKAAAQAVEEAEALIKEAEAAEREAEAAEAEAQAARFFADATEKSIRCPFIRVG